MKRAAIFFFCSVLMLQTFAYAANAEEIQIKEESMDLIIEEQPAPNSSVQEAPAPKSPETNPPAPNPPETNSPETRPVETNPPETRPLETNPPETRPLETNPPETRPPETNLSETNTPETNLPTQKLPETNPSSSNPGKTEFPETDAAEIFLTEEETLETKEPNFMSSESEGTPAEGTEEDIIITREKMKKGIRSGEKFRLVVKIKNNRKDKTMKNIRLKLEPQEGIALDSEQKKDRIRVKDLKPGEERKVKVKMKAGQFPEDLPTLKTKAIVTYEYQEENTVKSGQAEAILLLPAEKKEEGGFSDTAGQGYGGGYDGGGYVEAAAETKTIDPMTPNIIISRYSYGSEIKAGEEFVLEMELQNTNRKIAVENTVMSVEPGEGLVLTDSSNTFYIEQLKPQEKVRKTVKLKALPDGQTANTAATVSFKYEYLKKEERTQANSEVKITMPVTHQDRFSVGEIRKEGDAFANEEVSISLPYVNKGKAVVYNLETRLETKMASDETYKFIGNVEAGGSGTLDFFVTPAKAGRQEMKVLVTYEDASGNEKTEERILVVNVEEGASGEMNDFFAEESFAEEETESSGGSDIKRKAVIVSGAAVFLFAVVFLKRRRNKKSVQFHGEI